VSRAPGNGQPVTPRMGETHDWDRSVGQGRRSVPRRETVEVTSYASAIDTQPSRW